MTLSNEQKTELVEQCSAALHGIEAISKRVSQLLNNPLPRPEQMNSMEAQAFHRRVLEEGRSALAMLKAEPAVAMVEFEWDDSGVTERFYFCRGAVAGILPDGLNGKLVSYRAELGRMVPLAPGEAITLKLPAGRREGYVLRRARVNPKRTENGWDAHHNSFDTEHWRAPVDSLLRTIQQWKSFVERQEETVPDYLGDIFAEADTLQAVLDQQHRRTIVRMELRDQPIVDANQDAVFRMPLDRQLILLGPPGAGKTTTLIKRVAQKRTFEALSLDEEESLADKGLTEQFRLDDSWVMFSPTDLLKLYVKEAFNREGVPASSQNIRTWAEERLRLGRDTLKILKSANSGRYALNQTAVILQKDQSKELASIYDELAEEVDRTVLERYRRSIEFIRESPLPRAAGVAAGLPEVRLDDLTVRELHRLSDRNPQWRNMIDALENEIHLEQKAIANQLIAADTQARLEALATLYADKPEANSVANEEDESEVEVSPSPAESARTGSATAKLLLRLVGQLAEATAEEKPKTRLAPFLGWVGERMPDSGKLENLGLKMALRRQLGILQGAARSLVFGVPTAYSKFRRDRQARGEYYSSTAAEFIRSNVLSPSEADILILLMLRNARRAASLSSPAWVENIEAKYRMQVYVDEATDFSSVQLACMVELAHPKLRSFFACGDFKQRITGHGIQSTAELEWIESVTGLRDSIEVREISSEYRQTSRLRRFAIALAGDHIPPPSNQDEVGEPSPLLAEYCDETRIAVWLGERIVEIERALERLPSIAIFVDGDDQLGPLVSKLKPLLEANNIPVVACRDGRDVGTVQEVRVFDIQHIKGLEFEAVFFVGIDRMAARIPDLFDKFLFVGVTRAATYLGITCEERLPKGIEHLRPWLGSQGWE